MNSVLGPLEHCSVFVSFQSLQLAVAPDPQGIRRAVSLELGGHGLGTQRASGKGIQAFGYPVGHETRRTAINVMLPGQGTYTTTTFTNRLLARGGAGRRFAALACAVRYGAWDGAVGGVLSEEASSNFLSAIFVDNQTKDNTWRVYKSALAVLRQSDLSHSHLVSEDGKPQLDTTTH